MRLLFDTHAALWWLSADERLGDQARASLTRPEATVLLSAAVVVEVSIKRTLGKLTVPDGFADELLGRGATALPISIAHATLAGDLPLHHRDPFDRLLVAQARIEGAVLVSRDDTIRRHGVPMVW